MDGAHELLAAAEQTGRTAELGRLLREMAIQPITALSDGLSLFVNLHPMELYDRQLVAGAGTLEAFASRIVFEITQCMRIPDQDRLAGTLSRLRSSGFAIGLDDLPSGYEALSSVIQLKPQYVKIPMSRIHAGREDACQQRINKHLAEHCHAENIQLIVSHVENQQDLDLAVDNGCHLTQGHGLGRELEAAQLE